MGPDSFQILSCIFLIVLCIVLAPLLLFDKDVHQWAYNLFRRLFLGFHEYVGASGDLRIVRTRKGLYGVVDGMKWVVKPIYDHIEFYESSCYSEYPFAESFLILTKSGKKGIASKEGNTLLPIEYDAIKGFCVASKYALLIKDEKHGVFGFAEREILVPTHYDDIALGNPRVVYLRGKCGVYDWEKKTHIIPIEYDDIDPKDYRIVSIGDKWGIYDPLKEELVLEISYDGIYPCYKVFVVEDGDKCGVFYIDEGFIVPIEYDKWERGLLIKEAVILRGENRNVLVYAENVSVLECEDIRNNCEILSMCNDGIWFDIAEAPSSVYYDPYEGMSDDEIRAFNVKAGVQ